MQNTQVILHHNNPAMKRGHIIEQKNIQPVFFAPLTEGAVDVISGNTGTITGNNSATYSANGLHFRGTRSTSGVQYVDWNYGSHQIPTPSLTQSMTFLCDFYNDSTSGHNAILVFQKNTSSRFVSIVYNNRRWAVEKIGSGNVVAQLNQSISTNTWYNNSGFSWDANEKKLHLILNGEIKATSSVSSLPDYSNAQIRIGWADGSSDYFKGYLRNIRFYDKNYTIEMNM